MILRYRRDADMEVRPDGEWVRWTDIQSLEEQNEEAVDRWIAAQADAAHAEVRIEELEEQNAVLVEQYEAMDRSRAIVYRELTARVMELEEQLETAQGALRAIAEGGLGDEPWFANYARIREYAGAALNPASSSSDLLDKDYEVDATAQNQDREPS